MNNNNFHAYESDSLRLKLWISKIIEQELENLSGDGQGGKVSAIDFTYHNSWLLDMLREKGNAIVW